MNWLEFLWKNADPVTGRRRIVGKRTIISPAPLALPDNVDSASVPESLNEAGLPEVVESFEDDTKKRRVESFDESVDWFQRERSSIAWMTNVSDEREIFEIDVGDPLESERSFCRDSSLWLSKRLSDGKSSEVTYHRLLPGEQLQFDEAMTEELSQVLAANALRRLSQEEELNVKHERLLRMRWVLTWKYTEGGDEGKGEAGHFGVSASRAYKCTNCCTDTWKDVSSFGTSSMRTAQTSCPFW